MTKSISSTWLAILVPKLCPYYAGILRCDLQKPDGERVKSKIEAEEEKFDFSILDKGLKKRITLISAKSPSRPSRKGGSGNRQWLWPERRDPRYPFIDEQEDKPLKVEGIDVVSLRSIN